jgi:glutaredoxin 3
MKTVEIYSTPTCHFCHVAKDFFNDHKIAFTDYNVGEDMDKRAEAIDLTGQMGVPVIKITDGDAQPVVILGFNEGLLRDQLGIAA